MTDRKGPVELVMIEFPGNQFNGNVAPTFFDMVDKGLIRVIDLVVASKDADGTISVLEIEDLDDELSEALQKLTEEEDGLLSEEDLLELAAELPENWTALMILFENTWVGEFAEAVRESGGRVVLDERIPRPLVEEARAAVIAAAESV
ncbi:DUF6325 family protein [Pseudooceanicola sp. LIPI14-2-Ac024]|uniref:DUF6325 family protein n=1 Tax=Pseudooceanicola sp. LIPI14-2-Ac024 TaxID=3344875 RepID=UPI0035CFF36B